LPIPIGIEGRG